jgi:small conductance mechanosensitive channel
MFGAIGMQDGNAEQAEGAAEASPEAVAAQLEAAAEAPPESLAEQAESAVTAIDRLMEMAQAYAPRLAAAAIILVLGWMLVGLLMRVFRSALRRTSIEETLIRFLVSVVRIGLLAFVVVAAVAKLGVQTASFVAIIGAAGFAVGFALQGSLSNFAAGVMILIFRPFKVGDLVEANGALGFVAEVGIFATFLDTLDNKRVIVGNSAVTGGNITNYTYNDKRRVDMVFGIGYREDIDKARPIFERILADHPKVLATPESTVAVSELADSSVNFVVRPWCATDHYWDVYFDVHAAVKRELDAAGIEIPFPQRDVHMHQVA